MARAARLAAHGQAVHVGQAHVEHHQVGPLALNRREPLRSCHRDLDTVPGLTQFELEHTRDCGIVLDDQHSLRGSGHATTIAPRPRPLRILTEAPPRRLPGTGLGPARAAYGGVR